MIEMQYERSEPVSWLSQSDAQGMLNEMIAHGQQINASAQNVGGGFVVQQDYSGLIGDYRIKEKVPVWSMMQKKRARSILIQEQKRNAFVETVDFVGRNDLSTAATGTRPDVDQSDPGQEVKAIAGRIKIPHFAHSIARQQEDLMGALYGEQLAMETDELITAMWRQLNEALISGNATANPNSFNGLTRLISQAPDHLTELDITAVGSERISSTIRKLIKQSEASRTQVREIDAILCSPASYNLLAKEAEELRLYYNEVSIDFGITVPAINIGDRKIPIIESKWVDDAPGVAPGDPDVLRLYMLNKKHMEWHGVYPVGGASTFEPQIFDVTMYLNGQQLVNERMILLYGTPFLRNQGDSFYRLEVTAPAGSAFSVL